MPNLSLGRASARDDDTLGAMLARLPLTLAILALTLLAPRLSTAHIVVSNPPARDLGKAGADAHKNGPCGGVARTNKFIPYQTGQTVPVTFSETVDHRGCFQVWLSTAGDANFQKLFQADDPGNDATPRNRTVQVTLPAGVTCSQCTLQVRQLMINQTCSANQQSITAGDTYFTCADVCIGPACGGTPDAGPPDAGAPDSSLPPADSGQPQSDGAAPAPASDSGSPPRGDGGLGIDLGPGTGGCSSGGSSPSSFTAVGLVLVALGALRRRRTPLA